MRQPPQALVDSIKDEILMDLRRTRARGWPPGPGTAPFDRTLAESVKQQVLQQIEGNLRARGTYTSTNLDRDVEEIAKAIVEETLNRSINPGAGFRPDTGPGNWQQRLSNGMNDGQLKGLLYGLGTAALATLLLPSIGKKLHSVVTKTAEEGLDIFDKARSMVERAREGIEDVIAEASFNRFQAGVFEDNEGLAEPGEPKDNGK